MLFLKKSLSILGLLLSVGCFASQRSLQYNPALNRPMFVAQAHVSSGSTSSFKTASSHHYHEAGQQHNQHKTDRSHVHAHQQLQSHVDAQKRHYLEQWNTARINYPAIGPNPHLVIAATFAQHQATVETLSALALANNNVKLLQQLAPVEMKLMAESQKLGALDNILAGRMGNATNLSQDAFVIRLEKTASLSEQKAFYDQASKVMELKHQVATLEQCLEHNNALIAQHVTQTKNSHAKALEKTPTCDLVSHEIPRLEQQCKHTQDALNTSLKELAATQQKVTAPTTRENLQKDVAQKEVELAQINAQLECAQDLLQQRIAAECNELKHVQNMYSELYANEPTAARDEPLMKAIGNAINDKGAYTHTTQVKLTPPAQELLRRHNISPEKFNEMLKCNGLQQHVFDKVTTTINDIANIPGITTFDEKQHALVTPALESCDAAVESLKAGQIQLAIICSDIASMLPQPIRIALGVTKGIGTGLVGNMTTGSLARLFPPVQLYEKVKLGVAFYNAYQSDKSLWDTLSTTITQIRQLPAEKQAEFAAALLTNIFGPSPNPKTLCTRFLGDNNLLQRAADTAQRATDGLTRAVGAPLQRATNSLAAAAQQGAATLARAARSIIGNTKTPHETSSLWSFWHDLPQVIRDGREYAIINGRLYTRHAIDRMTPTYFGRAAGGVEGRGVPLSVVEDVIVNGTISGTRIVNGVERITKKLDRVEVALENDIIVSVLIKS